LSKALALGAAGALLSLDGAWGINVTALVIALAVSGAIGWRRARPDDDPSRVLGFIGAAIFALGFTVTENAILRWIDGGAILVLLSIPLLRPAQEPLRLLRPVALLHSIVESVAQLVVGGILLILNHLALPTRRVESTERSSPGSIIAGIGLAVVLAIVFGSLLRSADAVFDAWVGRTIDPSWLFARIAVALIVATLCGGWLSGWFDRPFGERSPFPTSDPIQFAPSTVLIPLATLLLLFGGFVTIQASYFFPGHSPEAGAVAQIARRGFFELVAVGGLALLVLLIADSSLRWAPSGARTAFRVVAMSLLVLVGAILASAVWRMGLYVERYGWTELRLFASVFLLWTAIILPWFGATALCGDPRRFTAGALLAALILCGGLHAISPEAVIVRSHLDPVEGGREFDYSYLQTLGVGAIPAIVARWERILPEQRVGFEAMFDRLCEEERTGFAWTLSRQGARIAWRELPKSHEK
jgi:hypothetical protein